MRAHVEPESGVHTNNVEGFWTHVKAKLKRMYGCHTKWLDSYMDEFLWLQDYCEKENPEATIGE